MLPYCSILFWGSYPLRRRAKFMKSLMKYARVATAAAVLMCSAGQVLAQNGQGQNNNNQGQKTTAPEIKPAVLTTLAVVILGGAAVLLTPRRNRKQQS